MKTGTNMALKTRLDPRTEDNNKFSVVDKEGNILCSVKLLGERSITLELTTTEACYITKESGWSSKKEVI